jgi:hypothetical protein
MAATIGNFSSGDVLTAAQMNKMGCEYVGTYTFSGYGGIVCDDIGDFTNYMVQWYGYLNTGSSALYLRFRKGGTEIAGSGYSYGALDVGYSSGSLGSLYNVNVSNIRVGSIQTAGSGVTMFISQIEDGRQHVAWMEGYGSSASYQGTATHYDASYLNPDGFIIYRSANLATMEMRVYGFHD